MPSGKPSSGFIAAPCDPGATALGRTPKPSSQLGSLEGFVCISGEAAQYLYSGLMLNETWPDQYQRMQRSLTRLRDAIAAEAPEARDALYHFWQDAFHLRDWIIAPPSPKSMHADTLQLFKDSAALGACRDIANGVKHLHLDRGKSWTASGEYAEVTGQSVVINMPRIEAVVDWSAGEILSSESVGDTSTRYSWTVRVNGADVDAVELAGQAVADWDSWLGERDML